MFHILKNCQVFAPEPLGTQHLVVAAGKVLWMGDSIPVLPDSFDCNIFDAANKRLIPGLIDGHAHLTGGGGESGFKSRVPPVALSRFTASGVTTVVGLLGTDDTTRDTQSLLAATYGLREEGMSAFCYTGGYHVPPTTLTGNVRSDIVNLDPVIGVGETAISDHRSSQPTLDELLRLASDAHVAGMISGKAGIVHLHLGDGVRGLELVREALQKSELPARVFNPTHINRNKALFEESLGIARLGCFVDVTAFPVADDDDAWSADEALLRYLDSGSPNNQITVSSDGGGCLPVFDNDGRITHMDIGDPATLVTTLNALLDRGEPLERVLPAFTQNVATLLRLNEKGAVAVGNDADLVVLSDDNSIDSVMVNGVWHRQDGVQKIVGQFEQPEQGRQQ